MFKELIRAFFSVVRSPLLLLPALFAVLANLAALLLVQEPVLTIFAELMNSGFSEFESVYFLVSSLSTEFFWILILVFATILVNSWLSLSLARFARLQGEKKLHVFESVLYAVSKIGRLIAWSIFVLLIGFVFLFFLFAVSAIGYWNEWLGLLLLLFWLVCTLLVFFVLTFAVPVMGLEDTGIKYGLQKSGGMVKRHFLAVFVFMLVLGVFVGIVSWIGDTASEWVEDENLSILVLAIFLLVQNVIANLALPFYYLEKRPSS